MHKSCIVFGNVVDSLLKYDFDNPKCLLPKWREACLGGIYNGKLLHVGSYDTNQAKKEYISKIDIPDCFIDVDGCYTDIINKAWEEIFINYYESLPEDTLITVIDLII